MTVKIIFMVILFNLNLNTADDFVDMISQPKRLFEKGVTVDYESCYHGFRSEFTAKNIALWLW